MGKPACRTCFRVFRHQSHRSDTSVDLFLTNVRLGRRSRTHGFVPMSQVQARYVLCLFLARCGEILTWILNICRKWLVKLFVLHRALFHFDVLLSLHSALREKFSFAEPHYHGICVTRHRSMSRLFCALQQEFGPLTYLGPGPGFFRTAEFSFYGFLVDTGRML
jgi:hypothetical protein